MTTIPKASGSRSADDPNESIRRVHRQNPCLPLVLLLQYASTAWVSEIVHTDFSTSGIHHTVVSTLLNDVIKK